VDRNSAQANQKACTGAAISDASLAWRADINFLAGIIKRGYPTAPYFSDMLGLGYRPEFLDVLPLGVTEQPPALSGSR
jgi:hypothetical protein